MTSEDPHPGIAGLPFPVIRIRAGDPNDASACHYGTGFFYGYGEGDNNIPVIVSNKHVLCGKTWIEFDFASKDDQGKRVLGPSSPFRVLPGRLPIFEHPDPSVDLAAMPLVQILDWLAESKISPYIVMHNKESFAPDYVQKNLHASSNVLMVGFPKGIMDETNNLPIVRRGTLATTYQADYLGRTDFVVDIATFGGSSGSPVYAFLEHTMLNERGHLVAMTEPRTHLIGVLHSGPIMTAEGQIVPAPVPTSSFVAQTKITINLGYCVKASRIEQILQVIEGYLLSHGIRK